MITVTSQAAEQIRAVAGQSGAEALGLRVAAKRGADGSIDYGMGFDEERDNDERIEAGGVTLLISPHSRELLDGVTLDYVELEPGDFRFIFINPADQSDPSSCGTEKSAGTCGGCQGSCG